MRKATTFELLFLLHHLSYEIKIDTVLIQISQSKSTSIHDMFGMYVRYIRLARTFSSWMPGAADYRLLLLYIAGTSMVKLLSNINTSLNFIEISIAKCI